MASNVHAETKKEEQEKGITAYGVSCPICVPYGYCSKQPTYKEAGNALKSYYKKKGLTVSVTKEEGRLIEADVYKDREIVDRILLDCKTGKIRSIY